MTEPPRILSSLRKASPQFPAINSCSALYLLPLSEVVIMKLRGVLAWMVCFLWGIVLVSVECMIIWHKWYITSFTNKKNVKFCEVLGKQNYRHNAGWKLSYINSWERMKEWSFWKSNSWYFWKKCICLHLDIALERFYYISSIICGINTSWSWTLFYNHKKRISCPGSRKQLASYPYIYFLCMLYTNIKKVVVQVRWIATSSKKKKRKKKKESIQKSFSKFMPE